MASDIPVDAYLVTVEVIRNEIRERTIRVGRGTQTMRERVEICDPTPPGITTTEVRNMMAAANTIWTPASITFTLRSTTARSVRLAASGVTDNDFRALARRDFAPREGVSLMWVRDFAGADGGGGAIESFRACIVSRLGGTGGQINSQSMSNILAHEFGHLLHLDHTALGTSTLGNLMRPGLRPPSSTNLTPTQISTAQGSALAQAYPK